MSRPHRKGSVDEDEDREARRQFYAALADVLLRWELASHDYPDADDIGAMLLELAQHCMDRAEVIH
jgi:hypothetical protein